MGKQYTNVAIPTDLAEEIDKVLSKSKLGYTSGAQSVMEAVRKKIKEES